MPEHPLAKLHHSIPVAIQRSGEEDRHLGQFVGMIQGECVIVAGFKEAELSTGEELVVRMISGPEALGFRTKVLGVVAKPRLYLLEFPAKVQTQNLRKNERIPVFLPGEVQMQTDQHGEPQLELLNAMLVDLSAGGCSFTTKRPIYGGSTVKVSFTLPGERLLRTLTGKVIDTEVQDAVFTQRMRFAAANQNIAEIGEISRWVQLNAGFARS